MYYDFIVLELELFDKKGKRQEDKTLTVESGLIIPSTFGDSSVCKCHCKPSSPLATERSSRSGASRLAGGGGEVIAECEAAPGPDLPHSILR